MLVRENQFTNTRTVGLHSPGGTPAAIQPRRWSLAAERQALEVFDRTLRLLDRAALDR